MDCKKESNLKECNCSYPGCLKRGICCQCVKYHREKGELPACYFSPSAERSYDRSVEKYLKDKNAN